MSFSHDLDFTGRRILVTGASNGFGAAMATLFHAAGARLVLADIEEQPLAEIAARCGAEAHVFDQADPDSVKRLAEAAGPVDTLINNAGVLVAKPLLETSFEELRRIIDIDLVGALQLMQLVGRGMVERRRGVILSIGSQTAFSGGENRAVYAAAKAAISQVTKSAAVGPSRGSRRLPRAGPVTYSDDATDSNGGSVRRSRPCARSSGPLGNRGGGCEDGDVPRVRRGVLRHGRDGGCRWWLCLRLGVSRNDRPFRTKASSRRPS